LRAVVLDAVVPLGFSLVTGVPAVRQTVMLRYAQSCAASPACNEAYPDLANRYQALLEKLDKDPVPVALGPAAQQPAARTAAPPASGTEPKAEKRPDTATITGRDFDAALYQSVYQREAVPFIPYIVQRAEQGDFSFMLNIVRMMQASNDDMADAMYMTVVCAEFGDTPESALQFPGVIKRLVEAGQNDARQILALCRDWHIRLLDKSLLQPVKSDIPTLLLSGHFDPITPPEQADRVAAHLSRAFKFTFPRGAHGQAFLVPCANFMIANFLENPGRSPDGSCAREAEPGFVTPDQLISLPALKRGGSATVQDQMAALAGPARAVVVALLLLFSAVPVYAVTEVVRIFRRRAAPLPGDWRGRMILAAPWVPVLAAILLSAFIAAAVNSVGSVLQRNQFLLLLGAVPAWVKELSWGLVPFMLVMALMTLITLLLWFHRARSTMGRLYYTAQVIAGWSVCVALVKTGLFGF
jgi:pimeloyl-ACP methyl ester carboxylesterase